MKKIILKAKYKHKEGVHQWNDIQKIRRSFNTIEDAYKWIKENETIKKVFRQQEFGDKYTQIWAISSYEILCVVTKILESKTIIK